jgi:hypothetical protein
MNTLAHPLMATAEDQWPDGLDSVLVIAFLALIVMGPAIGYWLMIVDIRAYLRALRGMLVVVKDHLPHFTPYWAHRHTPGCIRSLGLELPCTEAEVKQAYRRLAETLHPDRGGDRQRFLLLQGEFEAAIEFVRDHEATNNQETTED